MHQGVNVYICNFAIFGLIFMEFSPNCTAKELGMLFTILGSFWESADIRPLNRPRKRSLLCNDVLLFQFFL